MQDTRNQIELFDESRLSLQSIIYTFVEPHTNRRLPRSCTCQTRTATGTGTRRAAAPLLTTISVHDGWEQTSVKCLRA